MSFAPCTHRCTHAASTAGHEADEVPATAAGGVMAKRHGKTARGIPITDALIAEQADAGYDVDETLRRREGRPPIGSAAASVESGPIGPRAPRGACPTCAA